MSIRIGIFGYGNLGRGVEAAIRQNRDMTLSAVFTRRDPSSLKIATEGVPVVHVDDVQKWTDKIDVMILCGGSATDLPEQTPALAKYFNVVDSFDTHAKIPEHFENVDKSARESGKVGIISVGWDPGMFSLNRLFGGAVLVDGKDVGPVTEYTFKNVRTDHTISVVFEKAPWVNPFTDVTENDWFYEDVKFVSETGLMNGNSADGKLFDPSVITNRAMLVTILWRLEGCPTVSSSVKFTDVDANAWYADAVNWASANDIILGDETGAFGANDELTREQAALILYRYAAYKGVIEGSATADSTELKASDWAKDAVIWAEANGLLKGIGVDTSDMTKGISRAEIAAYLRRFCENFLAK